MNVPRLDPVVFSFMTCVIHVAFVIKPFFFFSTFHYQLMQTAERSLSRQIALF